MNFKNKKVAVIGLGKSGFAAAKFLNGLGARVRVTEGSDKKEALESADFLKSLGVSVETGGHTADFIKGSALVVTSPGVSKKSVPLMTAEKLKIPVISEIELASFFCRGFNVAVTGSNGKTTTSHLIHRILLEAGKKSVLCGNVGYSFLEAVREIEKRTFAVIELSSFQLEDIRTFRPKIAAVLNISPNHLDRHGSMENYVRAKEKIFKNQRKTDTLILNYDDPAVRAMSKKAHSRIIYFSKYSIDQGVFVRDGKIIVKIGKKEKVFLNSFHLKLKGQHNLENALAAAAIAWVLKIPARSLQKTLSSFETLEHRIEPVGETAGVHFIDDSKSTTVESTKAAILTTNRPMILIAGGRDKGAHFAEIEPLLEDHVKSVILYGEAREKIAGAWKRFDRYEMEKDFRSAVISAFRTAKAGDSILLSPMCTSFDQFSCFEERGEVFKKIFKEIKESSASAKLKTRSGASSFRSEHSPLL